MRRALYCLLLTAAVVRADADADFKAGLAALKEQKWAAAIKAFDAVIDADPKRAGAYHNRALALVSRRGKVAYADRERVLADYTKALELNPKLAAAWRGRGEEYYQDLQYDKALADLGRALSLDPKDADALYLRGRVYLEAGRGKEADADFDAAAKADGEMKKAVRAFKDGHALLAAGAVYLLPAAGLDPDDPAAEKLFAAFLGLSEADQTAAREAARLLYRRGPSALDDKGRRFVKDHPKLFPGR